VSRADRQVGVSHPTALDVSDPAALEAALLALPEGTWVEVFDGRDTFRVERVPGGGLYLPGDVVIQCGDVAWAQPERVAVVAWP
jgi:hypothetical protein